ncbi:putative exonuclease mut-7 like protein [Cricetulus griseus]|nr:putative exonuclease mut-7 like protein [Cricetulus griseus]
MARGKQTPQDAGGTEAIWAGSPIGAIMISLKDIEGVEMTHGWDSWLVPVATKEVAVPQIPAKAFCAVCDGMLQGLAHSLC